MYTEWQNQTNDFCFLISLFCPKYKTKRKIINIRTYCFKAMYRILFNFLSLNVCMHDYLSTVDGDCWILSVAAYWNSITIFSRFFHFFSNSSYSCWLLFLLTFFFLNKFWCCRILIVFLCYFFACEFLFCFFLRRQSSYTLQKIFFCRVAVMSYKIEDFVKLVYFFKFSNIEKNISIHTNIWLTVMCSYKEHRVWE